MVDVMNAEPITDTWKERADAYKFTYMLQYMGILLNALILIR
jgi:hypothetical protein